MSVTLDQRQYQHIVQTQGEDEAFSERLRDVLDKGIAVEREEVMSDE